jgi:hypothetical protein
MSLKALISIIFILIAQNVFAEDMRYYDVEVVVIENLKSRTHTEQSENWPVDVTLEQPEKTVQLGEPVPAGWLPEGVDPKASYTLIDPSEYQLTPDVEKISESKSLRVIYHTAWRQPGLDKEIALPVHFKQEIPPVPEVETPNNPDTTPGLNPDMVEHKTTPSVLEGIFRVTLARYLHFNGEMTLRDDTAGTKNPSQAGDSPFSFLSSEDTQDKQHVIYFNQERRRIRSNELHYLDHPVISMLLRITPYEKPEAATQPVAGKKAISQNNKIKR